VKLLQKYAKEGRTNVEQLSVMMALLAEIFSEFL
jgi:hypothetical protein